MEIKTFCNNNFLRAHIIAYICTQVDRKKNKLEKEFSPSHISKHK